MQPPHKPVGALLRSWRERRRLSQLELALRADISTRHLSFVETSRAKPSSTLILQLSEHLDIPLRERNRLLLAGGFAPLYPQHQLTETPMAAISEAINRILTAHEPYPAVVIDHKWELVAGNDAVAVLTDGADSQLLEPPVNVLRLSLHPKGLAPRIVNLGEWRAHLLNRLDRQIAATDDDSLRALRVELRDYPTGADNFEGRDTNALLVPLRYRTTRGSELRLFSTTTVFGTPLDVTVAELAIEAFYPADTDTANALLHSQYELAGAG
jgi:transcriptional regulator with XRE-family HTH domain